MHRRKYLQGECYIWLEVQEGPSVAEIFEVKLLKQVAQHDQLNILIQLLGKSFDKNVGRLCQDAYLRDAQAEAKRLLLLKYSNRWFWDICMGDSRTFAVGIGLAKYGHFSKQKWLVILYLLAMGRGEKQQTEKEKACLLHRFYSFKTKSILHPASFCPQSTSKFIH